MYLNDNKKIILFIILVFFISANIAWLNPRPDFAAYAFFQKIPIFWQYNTDASTEILSATYFPYYFLENNIRLERPGYSIIIGSISEFFQLFLNISDLKSTAIVFIIFKFTIYITTGLLFFKFAKKFFNEKICLIGILLFFSQKYSIMNATSFHTTELSILSPVLILSFFLITIQNYSVKKNFIFSIIVGFLMMCKPNYATYLSILIFVLLKRNIMRQFLVLYFILFH